MITERRAVITGMGAVTPLGLGVDALWDGWISGRIPIDDGIAACRAFDDDPGLSRRELRRLDRFAQFAAVATTEAAEQAGWEGRPPCDPLRAACVVGTAIGGAATLEEQLARALAGASISPLAIPQFMGNAAAADACMRFGLQGSSFAPVSACSAGAHAIGLGLRLIQHGEADAVACGGSEAALSAFIVRGMATMQTLSPTGASRPFHRDRDGIVMGEGAGILMLEERELARRRGAVMIAEVLGFGQTTDAHHITAPEPSGRLAAAAMRLCLQDAGREAGDVTYVSAHGTGTPLNDAAETRAIEQALGPHAAAVPVSSLKSSIGHLIGAAGAVEAIAAVRALTERVAPPTLSLDDPDPALALDFVPRDPRPLGAAGPRDVILSNAFAFGGHNVVLAFGAP